MKRHRNIINGLVGIGAVLLVASTALFCAGCSKTVSWMNDKVEHTPGEIHDPDWKCAMTFAETNTVELGIRSDGVVVWRKVQ